MHGRPNYASQFGHTCSPLIHPHQPEGHEVLTFKLMMLDMRAAKKTKILVEFFIGI